jgi:hypothetical protein
MLYFAQVCAQWFFFPRHRGRNFFLWPVEIQYKFYSEIAKKYYPLDAREQKHDFCSRRSNRIIFFQNIETKYVFIDSID